VPFIIDASQSAGRLDLTLEESGADAICAPGHKGLFGIQGCGFVIFADKYRDTSRMLNTFVCGGNGVDSLDIRMPEYLPERLEAGTLSTPAIAALDAGISYINEVGIEEIEKRERMLRTLVLERLKSTKGVKVYDTDFACSNVTSFTVDGFSSSYLGERLDEAGICVRSGFHCSPLAHKTLGSYENGSVRISLGYFNTVNEIDGFYKSLKEIIK
jgi:selenocysteine lyase/cysteine desulfurase